jgi:hypothetical protein
MPLPQCLAEATGFEDFDAAETAGQEHEMNPQ